MQQAGHTQGGVGAQLQRVEVVVIYPFEQAVHRHQALEGFEVQVVVAHQQVAAFHQTQAQVASQVGMLEIGFVVWAWGEQGQVRVFARRAAAFQAGHQRSVGAGQVLHPQGLKGLRKLPRYSHAVF